MLRNHGVVGKFVEFYGDGVVGGAAGQPRHDRQHEPRVRLDLRDLPHRRGDPGVPAPHRPLRGAGRPRRGLRQGAGPVARRRRVEPRFSECLELDLSTVVPVDRRAEAPAGPHRADRCQGGLPQGAADLRGARRGRPRATAASFPASDPTAAGQHRRHQRRRPSRPTTATATRRPSQQGARDDGRGHDVRDRPRHRVDRLDHLVHQHVQPVGDDGGGDAGQERRRARPDRQALGQDLDGAGLQGRHGLLREGRHVALPGEARLPPRRLRLHHLHRQLRPARRGDLRGRPGATTSPSSRCSRATATSRAGSTPTSR